MAHKALMISRWVRRLSEVDRKLDGPEEVVWMGQPWAGEHEWHRVRQTTYDWTVLWSRSKIVDILWQRTWLLLLLRSSERVTWAWEPLSLNLVGLRSEMRGPNRSGDLAEEG